MSYKVGDVVRVTGTWTNAAGTAIDPDTVSFEYRLPGGATTTTYEYGTDAEVVKSATGIYYVDVSQTAAGTFRAKWLSTGDGQAAETVHFNVESSSI